MYGREWSCMVIHGFVGEQMEFWDYVKYGEYRKYREYREKQG